MSAAKRGRGTYTELKNGVQLAQERFRALFSRNAYLCVEEVVSSLFCFVSVIAIVLEAGECVRETVEVAVNVNCKTQNGYECTRRRNLLHFFDVTAHVADALLFRSRFCFRH